MMNENFAHWSQSRQIVERVVVTGELVLLTPAHLGNGEADGLTDMTLLRDPLTSTQALLTGASIAGALRNYLREVCYGYQTEKPEKPRHYPQVALLFGGDREDDKGSQSALIVDDALSVSPQVTVRDGVRIDPCTGAAMVDDRKKGYKFDLELLEAGTVFPLRFELLIPIGKSAEFKAALAQVLQGLEQGEIGLGARKRRGFGKCEVRQWSVTTYDLTQPAGLLAWLNGDETAACSGAKIAPLLDVNEKQADQRAYFEIKAVFQLDGSLLIRSETDAGKNADTGHLHTLVNGERVPVLPGSSLAGVLRHRALRIANTLSANGTGSGLVNQIFGSSEKPLTASRVSVNETVIKGTRQMVQNRVKIDRFTGGAYPTGLFGEQPLWGGADSRVTVELRLRNPQDYEVGLLMLLLKDLWTSDLPVGGERNIGRGRLLGREATLDWQTDGKKETWGIIPKEDGLQITGELDKLEACVQALAKRLRGGRND